MAINLVNDENQMNRTLLIKVEYDDEWTFSFCFSRWWLCETACVRYNHPMTKNSFDDRTEGKQRTNTNFSLPSLSLSRLERDFPCFLFLSRSLVFSFPFFSNRMSLYILRYNWNSLCLNFIFSIEWFSPCRQSFQIGSQKWCYFIEKNKSMEIWQVRKNNLLWSRQTIHLGFPL